MATIYELISFIINYISYLGVSSILNAGVIVAIATFLFQTMDQRRKTKKESDERLCRVCNTLSIEVDELNDWYESPEYKGLKTRHYSQKLITTAPYERIEYNQNIINTAPYQGIINSGLITYLKEETQKKLNEYYFIATVHNKRMYDLVQIYNNIASSPEFNIQDEHKKITNSVAWELNEIELTKYENKMQELMPELKRLLNNEIKNSQRK